VREALSTLEVPYLLHNVAPGSPRGAALVERSGAAQVPYLVDPNVGAAFTGDAARAHVERTYRAS
jgi:hypothetical protein